MFSAELDHAAVIDSNVSATLGLLTLLGGAVFYLFSEGPRGSLPGGETAHVVILVLSVIALLSAAGFLAWSWWWPYRYEYVADPAALEQWYRELEAFDWSSSQDNPAHTAAARVSERFQAALINAYVEASQYNRTTNRQRARWLYRSKTAAIVTAILLAVAALPHAELSGSDDRETASTPATSPASQRAN